MRNLLSFLLVSISVLLCSCNSRQFSNGKPVTQTHTIQKTFKVLMMYDDVDVHLIPDGTHSSTTISITAGENIIDNITDTIIGDTLIIHNENTLNWLRDYDSPKRMEIHYDSIQRIIFESNGKLTNQDSLSGKHYQNSHETTASYLYLDIKGGSGDIDLTVNPNILKATFDEGTSSVTFKGKVNYAETTTKYDSHGPINAQYLYTNQHVVSHRGTNIAKVRAKGYLTINNYNNGTVYYVKYKDIPDQGIYYPEYTNLMGPCIYAIYE